MNMAKEAAESAGSRLCRNVDERILRGRSRQNRQKTNPLSNVSSAGSSSKTTEQNYFLQQQLTAALKAELGTNFGTLAAGMVMASPVAGLRPVRSGRS